MVAPLMGTGWAFAGLAEQLDHQGLAEDEDALTTDTLVLIAVHMAVALPLILGAIFMLVSSIMVLVQVSMNPDAAGPRLSLLGRGSKRGSKKRKPLGDAPAGGDKVKPDAAIDKEKAARAKAEKEKAEEQRRAIQRTEEQDAFKDLERNDQAQQDAQAALIAKKKDEAERKQEAAEMDDVLAEDRTEPAYYLKRKGGKESEKRHVQKTRRPAINLEALADSWSSFSASVSEHSSSSDDSDGYIDLSNTDARYIESYDYVERKGRLDHEARHKEAHLKRKKTARLGIRSPLEEAMEKFRDAFDGFDKDEDGRIPIASLRQVLERAKMPEDVVKSIIVDADANADDGINFDEFVDMMRGHSEVAHLIGAHRSRRHKGSSLALIADPLALGTTAEGTPKTVAAQVLVANGTTDCSGGGLTVSEFSATSGGTAVREGEAAFVVTPADGATRVECSYTLTDGNGGSIAGTAVLGVGAGGGDAGAETVEATGADGPKRRGTRTAPLSGGGDGGGGNDMQRASGPPQDGKLRDGKMTKEDALMAAEVIASDRDDCENERLRVRKPPFWKKRDFDIIWPDPLDKKLAISEEEWDKMSDNAPPWLPKCPITLQMIKVPAIAARQYFAEHFFFQTERAAFTASGPDSHSCRVLLCGSLTGRDRG